MKKRLALTICLVLAVASVASAADLTWPTGITIKGSQTWMYGAVAGSSAPSHGGLAITAKGKGDGWDVEATMGTFSKGWALGAWRMNVTDGKMKVTTWGNRNHSAKGTPWFVSSPAAGGNWKVRVDYAPVTFDFASKATSPEFYAFAEQKFDPATVGMGVKALPDNEDLTVSGYVKMPVADIVNLTGEVAMQNSKTIKDKNAMFGIQGVVSLPASITATARYLSRAENVGDSDVIYLEGKQDATGLLELKGSYTINSKKSTDATTSTVLSASVKARGDKKQSYDDTVKYDKYYNNTSWGAQGVLTSTKSAPVDTDNPANSIVVKGTTPIIPGKAWVLGIIDYKSDADGYGAWGAGPLSGTVSLAAGDSRAEVNVYGRYNLSGKTRFDAQVTTKSQGGDNYSKLLGKGTYMLGNKQEWYAQLESDSSPKYTGLKDDKKSCQKLTVGWSMSF